MAKGICTGCDKGCTIYSHDGLEIDERIMFYVGCKPVWNVDENIDNPEPEENATEWKCTGCENNWRGCKVSIPEKSTDLYFSDARSEDCPKSDPDMEFPWEPEWHECENVCES